MKLHFREIGEGKSLLILHGLYGSGENWLSIAKRLSNEYKIILADNRNHGLSFHNNSHTYENMCEDIKELLEQKDIKKTNIIAHSMGGKAAMLFSLKYPEMVDKLIIIDIAPKDYNTIEYREHLNKHKHLLSIFDDINLDEINNYTQFNKHLDKYKLDNNDKQLLAKNLRKCKDKTFRWKLNIRGIQENIENILAFKIKDHYAYKKECHFIICEESDYITKKDLPVIQKFFPQTVFCTIPQCGHSPHRDKPEELSKLLKTILLH
jgi:pimeloyl-ACP methyl ester carboxylesterase